MDSSQGNGGVHDNYDRNNDHGRIGIYFYICYYARCNIIFNLFNKKCSIYRTYSSTFSTSLNINIVPDKIK
jgi:hypothetical protein